MSSVEASYDQTTLRAETYDGVSIMSNARMRDTLDEYMDARYMGRIEAAYFLMGLEASYDQKGRAGQPRLPTLQPKSTTR